MAAAIQSDELTRVGPGTIMGDLMRQYWIPAAKSSEVIAGEAPLRLVLLGEKLIAFRSSNSGRVGVMDHRCPHRCASLFLARNEGDGLRCIYHGWKFDVDGNCTDMPNVAPAQRFEDRVKSKSYKVAERGGLIWVYMGSRLEAPPLPMIEATMLPDTEVNVTLVHRDCNWMQSLEGDIDTSHFGFLHVGGVRPDQVQDDGFMQYQLLHRAPEYYVADTDWGTMYAAHRPARGNDLYWRFAHFGFPFWTQVPQGDFVDRVHARAWVPMDDEHTMFFNITWTKMSSGVSLLKDGSPIPGSDVPIEYLPRTTDWFGRWRPRASMENDYMIDRTAQIDGSNFSGISNIHMQDQAVTESMGPITEHSFEHLGPSDQMIARTRRRLVHAARALQDNGTIPPGVDNPEVFMGARSGECVLDATDWREAYSQKVSKMVRPQIIAAAE